MSWSVWLAPGTLYALKRTTAPEIYRITPVDGTVFDRVPIPGFAAGAEQGGMEFDDSTGVLYASIAGQPVTLDPGPGAKILIGVDPATSGLEVTGSCLPPPSTIMVVPSRKRWSLLLLLIALFVVSMLAMTRSRPLRHQ
jgi:hypothetical protein